MECRICLEDNKPENLIRPCRCDGTSKWVHRDCLDNWRATSANDIAFTSCLECKFEYIMDIKEGKRNIKSCIFSHVNSEQDIVVPNVYISSKHVIIFCDK
jgi:hypothetical protein